MLSDYFLNKIKEIDDTRESIRFNNELLDDYEKKLSNLEGEDYEGLLNSMNLTSKHVEYMKDRLGKLEEFFIVACLFTSKLFLAFIVRVLCDITNRKFRLIDTGNEYIIVDEKDEKYTFPRVDMMNAYDFITQAGALLANYSDLKGVICDLLNIQMHEIEYESYKETMTYQRVYATLPANHPDILKEEIKMHPKFRKIVNELVDDIFKENEFNKADKEDYKAVYNKIMTGSLNELMEKIYWFGYEVTEESLAEIEYYRRRYGIDIHLTKENYLVYAKFCRILDHIDYLDKYGEYYIRINGHTQTKATDEERAEIDEIAKEVLTRDYTWREAREACKNFSNLDIFEDYEFPHNVDKLRKSTEIEVMTLFDKVDANLNLQSDLTKLENEATRLIAKLHAKENIRTLFEGEPESPEEAYLRRMILANWDINRVFEDKRIGREWQEEIKDELIKGVQLSKDTLAVLFDMEDCMYESHRIKHEEKLVDMACGTLAPFVKFKKIDNLYELAKKVQLKLGIHNGTVYYGDINTHGLPNGDKLYSVYCEDIEPNFKWLQEQYDYLYANAGDAEFLEGAVEIFGRIMVMQAFRKGNKRTAKAIFNAMLLSRRIIPPVNDLLEQDKRLFLDIAYGRYERYMKAKYKLLLQTADVKRQFAEGSFHEPLSVDDMEADKRAKGM